jgi:hypothetical protein
MRDVTAQAKRIADDGGRLVASNELFGDPVPGETKTLRIQFEEQAEDKPTSTVAQEFPVGCAVKYYSRNKKAWFHAQIVAYSGGLYDLDISGKHKSGVEPQFLRMKEAVTTTWIYKPFNGLDFSIRRRATKAREFTGEDIAPGTSLEVDTESKVDGVTYLRLADRVGWIFDRSDEGVLFQRAEDKATERKSTRAGSAGSIDSDVDDEELERRSSEVNQWLDKNADLTPKTPGTDASPTFQQVAQCGGGDSWWTRFTNWGYVKMYSLGLGAEDYSGMVFPDQLYDIVLELLTEKEYSRVAEQFPDAAKSAKSLQLSMKCLEGRVVLIVNTASK